MNEQIRNDESTRPYKILVTGEFADREIGRLMVRQALDGIGYHGGNVWSAADYSAATDVIGKTPRAVLVAMDSPNTRTVESYLSSPIQARAKTIIVAEDTERLEAVFRDSDVATIPAIVKRRDLPSLGQALRSYLTAQPEE